MLDQYVEEIILSEYAAAHGVEIPHEQIASAVRNDAGATVIEKRDDMRRERLIATISADVPAASDMEVRAYYDQHAGEFRTGEEVHVRQILVHDENVADDIEEKLKKGTSFETLSSAYSMSPNAKKGGEIGYVGRGQLPKMFEDEIFALKPGGISSVIRTESSFHIFKVDERRAAGSAKRQAPAPAMRAAQKDTERKKWKVDLC